MANSEQGACDLIRLLLSLGHRRIAVLAGPEGVSTAADRAAGYRRALAEAGLAEDRRLVLFDEYTHAGGQRMAEQVLAVQPRPTALFAANNFVAIGAYRFLRRSGLRVPEDVALVAFDDLPATMVMDPFLTVAAQPAYAMGQRATALLLDRLAGRAPEEHEEIVLPCELIIRRSSGDALNPQAS